VGASWSTCHQDNNSLSPCLFLAVLVFWLAVIFMSLSLFSRSPR
jgi:hypothetical protein